MTQLQKYSALPRASLIKRLERLSGQAVSDLQAETLTAKRRRVEGQQSGVMRFVRRFPLIGRGCVLGDRMRSRASIDQELDRALRG